MALGGSKIAFYGLPYPQHNKETALSTEVIREKNNDSKEQASFVEENQPKMVHDQEFVFDVIMAHLEEKSGGLLLLDGPSGIGKIFESN